jgi:hypothetical protein
VLKSFQPDKSPENDEIRMELIICLWPEIGKLLVNSFNESFEHDKLSTSQRQAGITFIEQKERKG